MSLRRAKPRIGAVYRPDFRPDNLREAAAAADQAGVDELWFWEDCFLQGGIAQAAVALASSRTLTVGIGLLPAPLRNVVTTAMEFATLGLMFPGRIRIGIGHGVQSWMHQAGAAVSSPLTLLREYVTALRELLAGRSVSVDGRYVRLSDVRLDWVPAQRLPVLIGGTGPKTLRLAGEIADGVILDSRYTPTTARDALGHVDAGRVDRPAGTPFSNVLFVACVPGDGAQPELDRHGARQNLTAADGYGVGGTAAAITAALEPYRAAGVDSVVLQPIGPQDAVPQFIGVCGEVSARVRGE